MKSSTASLVLTTPRSEYVIQIGMTNSHVTCIRGTYHGRMDRWRMADLPEWMKAEWAVATGFSTVGDTSTEEFATRLAQHLVGHPFVLKTHQEEVLVPEVIAVRWTCGSVYDPPEGMIPVHEDVVPWHMHQAAKHPHHGSSGWVEVGMNDRLTPSPSPCEHGCKVYAQTTNGVPRFVLMHNRTYGCPKAG